MPEIKIVDDLLAPREYLEIKFQGKEPFNVCTLFMRLLIEVMKISGKDVYETDIRWDVTEDPRTFFGVWWGKRDEDRWTKTRIKIRAQGGQSSKDKTGWINIMMKGWVETEYQYTNFIQKSFWWFFNYMFYFKQRRKYIDFGKDNIYKLKERITDILGISKEPALV
jgi:hypothetical protein